MIYIAQAAELLTTIANTRESGVAILLFMVVVFVAFIGIVKMATTSSSSSAAGFQAMATNLAEDNRETNKQYRIMVEQFAELKGKFGMLEIEFKGVVVKLGEEQLAKKEVLEKLDLITDELACVHQKLGAAEKRLQVALDAKELTDQENIELKAEVVSLRALVDTLRREMVLLQSTSQTALGDVDL